MGTISTSQPIIDQAGLFETQCNWGAAAEWYEKALKAIPGDDFSDQVIFRKELDMRFTGRHCKRRNVRILTIEFARRSKLTRKHQDSTLNAQVGRESCDLAQWFHSSSYGSHLTRRSEGCKSVTRGRLRMRVSKSCMKAAISLNIVGLTTGLRGFRNSPGIMSQTLR